MNHDDLLHLLGLATARGQQLELYTAQTLARALQVPDSTARLLTSSMGLGGTVSVLQTLADRAECGSLTPSRVAEWIPEAKAAVAARNRLIHTPWVSDADGIATSIVVKGSMRLETRSEAEMRADIALVAAAVESMPSLT